MSLINAISGLAATAQAQTTVTGKTTGDFGSALSSAIQQVDGYQQQAVQAMTEFLQGKGELHTVAMAEQRAETVFDFAVQVRNKVVSAYQEIMKMQL